MKIVVVGDWHSELHEEVVFRALKKLGHEVIAFPWHQYFRTSADWREHLRSFVKRAQNKYIVGPTINKLNRDLLAVVAQAQPDMVLIYRGTHIVPRTLRRIRIKAAKTIIVGYNNDDPFSSNQSLGLFRHFLASVPQYDLLLAYRHRNINDYRMARARRVELLRSWFVPERNYPVELDSAGRDAYECDVVFVGHYEDDCRAAYLEEIVRRGWRLRLFGPGYDWDPVIKNSPELSPLVPVRLVWGEEYNKALCGAKIALCFFSKLNRDTYTRRCFEIPATRTMMLSEYSDDLATLYVEGKEVEFFRDKDEMVRKIELYLTDDLKRNAVAENGWLRVHADGHDVLSRMRWLISQVEKVKG